MAHEDHQRAVRGGVGSGDGVVNGVHSQCEVEAHLQFEVQSHDPWIHEVRWVSELEAEERRSGNVDFCE